MLAIVDAIPALNLPSADANELTVIATTAIAEVGDDSQDHAKFRLAAQKLRDIIVGSAKAGLSKVLIALIDSALVKIGLPPTSGA